MTSPSTNLDVSTELATRRAREAVAVGADLERGDRVMQFVMAFAVQAGAGVAAVLALSMTAFITSETVSRTSFGELVLLGVSTFFFVGLGFPTLALLSGVFYVWGVVPLGLWSLRSTRKSTIGLTIALVSSAVVLAWISGLVPWAAVFFRRRQGTRSSSR